MSRTARATAIGAVWNYGAQIATVTVQLGYAALTSRLLGPEAFGRYGIALTVTALVTLVATAGLPQAVGRMQRLDGDRLSGLACYALAAGGIAAAFLCVTAEGWAALWGVPDVAGVLRALALGSFFTPATALGTGLLLRRGRFRALAAVTLTANVVGMAVGLVAVHVGRTAVMLVVSPVLAGALAALGSLALSHGLFRARPRTDALLGDIAYSLRMTVSSLLSYGAGNVGKFALAHGYGAPLLGHWNRAEVLTSIPLTQAQNALTQVLVPEFRHDIAAADRARRVWADLLGLVAWICLPVAAVLAVVAPAVVSVAFGPGWSVVGSIAPALALLGGVQATVFVLVSALEVLGRFGWIWTGYGVAFLVNAVGGVTALVSGSFVPVLVSGVVSLVAMHGVQVWFCHRAGLLQAGVLLGHYARVVLACLVLSGLVFATVHVAAPGRWVGVLSLVAVVVALGRLRERLPVVRLARKFGILAGRAPLAASVVSG